MRHRWLAATTVAALALAGCGGDDGLTGSNDGGSDASVITDAPDTTGADSTGDTASDDTGGPPPESFLDEDIPLPLSEECSELAEAVEGAFSGIGTGTDSDMFAGLSDAYDRLREVVPDDLKPDVDVLSEAYSKIDDVLAEFDYDFTQAFTDPEAQAAISEAFADEDGSIAEASTRLNTWFQEQCPTGE
ncbi:MAG: hypothetical protein WAS51_16040 [Ilumatobacteraceae bacterium]